MATRLLISSFRTTARKTIDSALSHSFPPFHHRPLVALAANLRHSSSTVQVQNFATTRETTTLSLEDQNPNWSDSPAKKTVGLEGCDFKHWLVVVEKPEENTSRDEIIDSYIKTLAQVVGSKDEARMKIYSVSTKYYFAFGALVSEELSAKLKEVHRVRWVLPDSYLYPKTKNYGGEPFLNGKAVPYDPKYHREWLKTNYPGHADLESIRLSKEEEELEVLSEEEEEKEEEEHEEEYPSNLHESIKLEERRKETQMANELQDVSTRNGANVRSNSDDRKNVSSQNSDYNDTICDKEEPRVLYVSSNLERGGEEMVMMNENSEADVGVAAPKRKGNQKKKIRGMKATVMSKISALKSSGSESSPLVDCCPYCLRGSTVFNLHEKRCP